MKLTHFACIGWGLFAHKVHWGTHLHFNEYTHRRVIHEHSVLCKHRHKHTLLIMTGWGISYSCFAILPAYFSMTSLGSQTVCMGCEYVCECVCVHACVYIGSSLNQLQKHTVCPLCRNWPQRLEQDLSQDLDRVSYSAGPCPQKLNSHTQMKLPLLKSEFSCIACLPSTMVAIQHATTEREGETPRIRSVAN